MAFEPLTKGNELEVGHGFRDGGYQVVPEAVVNCLIAKVVSLRQLRYQKEQRRMHGKQQNDAEPPPVPVEEKCPHNSRCDMRCDHGAEQKYRKSCDD